MRGVKKAKGIIAAILITAVLSCQAVLASPLDTILSPFSRVDIASLYSSYGFVIDSFIYFLILLGAAEIGLSKSFKGKGGRAIIVGVGIALALSACVWEAYSGFRLANLWPLALAIVLLTFGIAFYNIIRGGPCSRATGMLSFAFLFFFFQSLIPGIDDWFTASGSEWLEMAWSLLNLAAVVFMVWGIIDLILCIARGGGSSGGGGGTGPAGPRGPGGPQGPRGPQAPQESRGPQPSQQRQTQTQEPTTETGTEGGEGEGVVVEILQPPRNAPDESAVILAGSTEPFQISGRITGPNESYDYIFGFYNNNTGSLIPLMRSFSSVASGSIKEQSFDFTSLPPGNYIIALFARIPSDENLNPPAHITRIPEELALGYDLRKIAVIVGEGEITVEITQPPYDAPNRGAVKAVGDTTPLNIKGKISGPAASYDYIFGIYDIHGKLKIKLGSYNAPQGTEVEGNLNTSDCNFIDDTETERRGQLPPEDYTIFLFAQLGGTGPREPPFRLNDVPPSMSITHPGKRKIKVDSRPPGNAEEERHRSEEEGTGIHDISDALKGSIDNTEEIIKKLKDHKESQEKFKELLNRLKVMEQRYNELLKLVEKKRPAGEGNNILDKILKDCQIIEGHKQLINNTKEKIEKEKNSKEFLKNRLGEINEFEDVKDNIKIIENAVDKDIPRLKKKITQRKRKQ